jgi:hypothetical protein
MSCLLSLSSSVSEDTMRRHNPLNGLVLQGCPLFGESVVVVAQQMNKIQILSLSNLTLVHQFITSMAMMNLHYRTLNLPRHF